MKRFSSIGLIFLFFTFSLVLLAPLNGSPLPYLQETEGFTLDTALEGERDLRTELLKNPLDLNEARVRDLELLPGINWILARRIIEERKRLGFFSSYRELEIVEGMTKDLLAEIKPYVTLRDEDRRRAFSGDFRFRMRAVTPRGNSLLDSDPAFQENTYFYNRTRLRFRDRIQGGVLAKRASGGAPLTLSNLKNLGVVKNSLWVRQFPGLDEVLMGHYSLSFGQGLLFYESLGEFARPIKVKERGARPDFTSGSNEHLRGGYMKKSWGFFEGHMFFSEKTLDLKINPLDGSVDDDLHSLRQNLGDLTDSDDLEDNNTVSENLFGARFAAKFWNSVRLGITGYLARYSRRIDPVEDTFKFSHVFRGDRLKMGSVDFETRKGNLQLFGEVARSKAHGAGVVTQRGKAWTVTVLTSQKPFKVWIGLFDYDPTFLTRHGKGISFAAVGDPEALTHNQKGISQGCQFKNRMFQSVVQYTQVRFPSSMGTGRGTDPLLPSQGNRLYWENRFFPRKIFEIYFRYERKAQDRNEKDPVGGNRLQIKKVIHRYRTQGVWTPSDRLRFLLRWEKRVEHLEAFFIRHRGHYVMLEARIRPYPGTTFRGRFYSFDSPVASLTTGVEEIWNGTRFYRLAGNLGSLKGTPGSRWVWVITQKLGKNVETWFKYDANVRPQDLNVSDSNRRTQEQKVFGAVRHGFHFQVDVKWGTL